MNQLKADVIKAIEDNLPKTTVSVLADYLKAAEQKEELLKKAEQVNEKLRKENQDLQDQVNRAQDLDAVEKDLKKRELQLEARNRNFELELLRTQMQGMEAAYDMQTDLTRLVFGHPSVSIRTEGNRGLPDNVAVSDNGMTAYGSSIPANLTETTTHSKNAQPEVNSDT